MSQVSPQMALPSKPAPEYRQDPERVKYLLQCFKHGGTVIEPRFEVRDGVRSVTGYANVGALYTFRFSDLTEELLDGTAPEDTKEIISRTWQTEREKMASIQAALIITQQERLDALKDVAMWKDEAELMCRAAKRWAFYCAFALAGGIGIGYALARLA